MINLNYNYIGSNTERARFTEQENEAFRPFQIQYVIVPAGGGAAGGNNQFESGSDIPKFGIAGSGGVIASGSFCVQPFITYPIVIGKGGKGGFATSQSLDWTGSNGGNSAFYNIEAIGGDGGKSQVYLSGSIQSLAGNGNTTSASGADGGTGSQWTYNLPGCLPDPFNPGCHGGQLISESYYSGGGAGIIVSASQPLEIEYIIVGGGGGAMNNENTCNNGVALAGGGGAAITGSFVLEPAVQTYPIIVGNGGIGKYACGVYSANDGSGSYAFGVSASGGKGANNILNNGNSGTGSWGLLTPFLGVTSSNPNPPFFNGSGAGGAAQNGSGSKGGDGLEWVDGKYYGGGGGAPFEPGITTLQFEYYPGRGGLAQTGNSYSTITNGNSGSVVLRYSGTGSKATGGIIGYDSENDYTYHFFSASAELKLNVDTGSIYTSGLPGIGGGGLFNVSGSSIIPNTGGGAAATFYSNNGASGSDGFVAIRYEGAPLAEGGNIVVTDFYTYHLFSSSGDFYVIGQESNPNINPCA
jgi:hypothetical protein